MVDVNSRACASHGAAASGDESSDAPVDEIRRPPSAIGGRCVSYTANLARIGEQLLGTDAAWEKIEPAAARDAARRRFAAQFAGRSIPGIGRPPCWPACLDFRYAS